MVNNINIKKYNSNTYKVKENSLNTSQIYYTVIELFSYNFGKRRKNSPLTCRSSLDNNYYNIQNPSIYKIQFCFFSKFINTIILTILYNKENEWF